MLSISEPYLLLPSSRALRIPTIQICNHSHSLKRNIFLRKQIQENPGEPVRLNHLSLFGQSICSNVTDYPDSPHSAKSSAMVRRATTWTPLKIDITKSRHAGAPLLEDDLHKWSWNHSISGVIISTEIIHLEGERLRDAANTLLSVPKCVVLKVSKE